MLLNLELGAVRLGLCCAQQSDALNIALKVYLGGEMPVFELSLRAWHDSHA